MLLALIGKTCSGKTSVANELEKLGIEKVVNYTTRPPREGEIDGRDYHFVTDEQFQTLDNMGYFAEKTSYNIAEGVTWHYATTKEDINSDKCVIINPDNLDFYKKLNHVLIVNLYSDEETILERLRQRGSGFDDSNRRLASDREKFEKILNSADLTLRNAVNTPLSDLVFVIKCVFDFYKNKESEELLDRLAEDVF